MGDFTKAGEKFAQFCEIIAALRHPETGCPWDLEQNHESLQRFMIEEAYEAVAEMSNDAGRPLTGELGDVLLQVVLNAQVAQDDARFTVEDVLDSISEKMVRRHPHVFGTDKEKQQRDIGAIKSKWQSIKEEEKAEQLASKTLGFFEKHEVHKVLPAMQQAAKIGKLSKKIDFDWASFDDCFAHLLSEIEEFKEELGKNNSPAEPELMGAHPQIVNELADVYFTLAQVTRRLGLSPEVIAAKGNEKFLSRFKQVEALVNSNGKDVEKIGGIELNKAWNIVKS